MEPELEIVVAKVLPGPETDVVVMLDSVPEAEWGTLVLEKPRAILPRRLQANP